MIPFFRTIAEHSDNGRRHVGRNLGHAIIRKCVPRTLIFNVSQGLLGRLATLTHSVRKRAVTHGGHIG